MDGLGHDGGRDGQRHITPLVGIEFLGNFTQRQVNGCVYGACSAVALSLNDIDSSLDYAALLRDMQVNVGSGTELNSSIPTFKRAVAQPSPIHIVMHNRLLQLLIAVFSL